MQYMNHAVKLYKCKKIDDYCCYLVGPLKWQDSESRRLLRLAFLDLSSYMLQVSDMNYDCALIIARGTMIKLLI